MNMESQVLCSEVSELPENVFIKDVITSETHHVASNQPAKKQTRQWAAWTRQEEENFFNALRQVGKNFEKITSRVQSKNKDQVRHYYYRLVRRMNKLLGPELSLDAKNHKDTNAAMLRWWSLLEKHSCKASKLHLKPRRFKIFLETLEHQLLKDRKKNMRKRPFQGENCSVTPCLDRNNCKGDLSSVKQARQKRRSGSASTAAYKKWEKAAIAGVSLVADAAAHLEQTALDKLVDSVQYMQRDKGLNPVPRDTPRVPSFHQTMISRNSSQPLTKLKLQLFPINESIRKALEMDNHNPHLELTLSCRKKISSVLEHINRKWGSCSIASGELILLPYYAQSLNFTSCQKWTQDSVLSAADVYAALGSPPVFRLRYGWYVMPPQEPVPATAVSVFDWADSLTNISVGDLLSDVSRNNTNGNCVSPPASQISFSCDSFDAAVAAHISKNLGNNSVQPTIVSSIWDAEETCDAFTFHKNNVLSEKPHTSNKSLVPSSSLVEKLPEAKDAEVESMDECQSDEKPEGPSRKDSHTQFSLNNRRFHDRRLILKMPAGHGLRSRTRDLFARGFRKKGTIHLSTYLRTYHVGDYVDIKVNGAVHKGMPHKFYHGRTGQVWNVTKRAIGVEMNKQVGNRIIKKRIHVRIEHVMPSRCNEEIKLRIKKNDQLKAEAKAKGVIISTKRQPLGPKPGFMVPGTTLETVTPIPYDVVNDLKGGY